MITDVHFRAFSKTVSACSCKPVCRAFSTVSLTPSDIKTRVVEELPFEIDCFPRSEVEIGVDVVLPTK